MSNNFYFAALEACSVTNAAAVETTSRTIYLPPGGSLGPWRPSIKTADPEGLCQYVPVVIVGGTLFSVNKRYMSSHLIMLLRFRAIFR